MFNKEKGLSEKTNELETVIGPSVKMKGNFTGQGDVRVEGSIVGTLETGRDVKIGEGAKVKAEIKAKNVFIAGEVKGTIKAEEKTIISPTAKIFGDIETKLISIGEGAVFSGRCIMGENLEKTERDGKGMETNDDSDDLNKNRAGKIKNKIPPMTPNI